MKPDALLAWMTTGIHQPLSVSDDGSVRVCQRCHGASGHDPIPDDGALICVPCVYAAGRLAGDPLNAPISDVADVWRAHEDVVELRSCQEHGQCWAFDRRWPAARDLTLVSGVVL